MKQIHFIAKVFIVAGGINWGLIGLFGFNAIDYIFGQIWIDRLIYALMGLSAVYKIINWQMVKGH